MSNTTIQVKLSDVHTKIPTTSQLVEGEIAIKTHDGKMFFRKDANGSLSIVEVGTVQSNEIANVLYVSKSGNNSNNGRTLGQSFLTIEAALAVATSGTTIFVKSGNYTENNPLQVPAGVSLIGDNLRTTTIRPATTNQDLFHVRNDVYISGFTFRDHVSPAAAVAFPAGACVITISPYVQNCSSITTTGTGMRIDGSKALGLRSMVTDAFTQINRNGIGIHILNKGYAQLVSIFTVFCAVGILTESGGQCSITNSNSSFGTYGLKSNGVSELLYTGTVDADVNPGFTQIVLDDLSNNPRYGDVVKFDNSDRYYTVIAATPVVPLTNTSTITIETSLDNKIYAGNTASFYQRSLISCSGHTFEYVGSGTEPETAIPFAGGFPVQENEVIQDEDEGGKVFFTSTDQLGNFRVGEQLIFNRASGTITGETFDRSLFAVLTPYILAIEG